MNNNLKILITLLIFSILAGCASMFINGGTLVSEGYKIENVMVAYRTEGIVPERIQYFLVEIDEQQAIFERSEDGSGVLFETHWKDSQGDHFSGWVYKRHGYEFIIPTDRLKEGKKYVYPVNTYRIKTINGIERPVPNDKTVKAIARLIPK